MSPERRWSLYGGAGVTVGFAYSTYVNLEYAEWSERSLYSDDDKLPERTIKTERFEADNGFSASIYLPLGVDFRVGKNREFWKPIHFYFETAEQRSSKRTSCRSGFFQRFRDEGGSVSLFDCFSGFFERVTLWKYGAESYLCSPF
jgi:hypothetical protein